MRDRILTAGSIITMNEARPRADAVAVRGDRIVAVGTLQECQAALPNADVLDTGAVVLMPGFIDPHSHPFFSGVATQRPAVSIAPWVAADWAAVMTMFAEAAAASDPALPLVFNGFDALLHGRPAPDADELDDIFGDRVVVVADNSGHGTYFTSALIRRNGWDRSVPDDPVGGRFGRTASGALNGVAYEVSANALVLGPVLQQLGGSLIVSAAEYYALMARAGITSTSDMTFSRELAAGYEALAALPDSPLRVSMWQVSTATDFDDDVSFTAGEERLVKQGVKLWTDGSPWIGNIAVSFPYLDTEMTERAGIDPGLAGGTRSMNYTRDQVDAILDRCALRRWQMAFHANGDLAIDFALDAYERALAEHDLLGSDHRWRIEHAGAARKDQFERAARLGVHVSLAPFQYYFWGDLLDGAMFDAAHGDRWQAFADAVDSGVSLSFHNDGSVSPPDPILNVQTAITRLTRSGSIHAPEQCIDIASALRAHTIDAAFALKRDHIVGSIEPGKLADFVELAADPFAVDPVSLAKDVAVLGTWLGGRRIDLAVFLSAAGEQDASAYAHLTANGLAHHAC